VLPARNTFSLQPQYIPSNYLLSLLQVEGGKFPDPTNQPQAFGQLLKTQSQDEFSSAEISIVINVFINGAKRMG